MLETMAMKINKKNYPVAVACLPGYFTGIPFSRVNGQYLVINEVSGQKTKEWGIRPIILNSWMTKRHFNMKYVFPKGEKKNQFVRVVRINA